MSRDEVAAYKGKAIFLLNDEMRSLGTLLSVVARDDVSCRS
jgi:hypothetical protein